MGAPRMRPDPPIRPFFVLTVLRVFTVTAFGVAREARTSGR